MVPRTMLKEWAMTTFPSATDYWTFRKMFTLQLALAGFAEYVLHLSRLNPDMMYIHQVGSQDNQNKKSGRLYNQVLPINLLDY